MDKMLYDIKVVRHINDKGDESYITVIEADSISLGVLVDYITEYVSGEYEITVMEHKENEE